MEQKRSTEVVKRSIIQVDFRAKTTKTCNKCSSKFIEEYRKHGIAIRSSNDAGYKWAKDDKEVLWLK